MCFLDVRLGGLASLQQRVAAERDDDPHASPIVAIMVALMVWSLFSAWSNVHAGIKYNDMRVARRLCRG